MFSSEEQIVESLSAAKPAEGSGDTGSLGQRIAAFFGAKRDTSAEQEEKGFPDSVARQLATLAKPCISLETRSAHEESEIPLGATKIGGRPDLPQGMDWPVRQAYPDAEKRAAEYREDATAPNSKWDWATAEQCDSFRRDNTQMIDLVENPFPLEFIAQINLEEVRCAGPLDPDIPKSGLLSIFYDAAEQPWGFDPSDHVGSAVLFHDQAPDSLNRLDTPPDLTRLERYQAFAPLACRIRAGLAPIPAETAVFRRLGLPEELESLYLDWWIDDDGAFGPGHWSGHRVGGWPLPIQGDMQTECALVAAGHYCGDSKPYIAPETAGVRATASDWLLLAQIDSDDEADMMWGDSGALYFWIRREDLVARRFDAVRALLQCC